MIFDNMLKGQFDGFFAWGQNPACSGANSNKTRQALTKLKWMVNVNLFDNETGSFWRGPDMNPKEIQTEVFMLPCASSVEKEGSISNSGRWAQWRYKAVEPVGESLPDAEIMNELYFKVKEMYKKEGGAYPDPIVNLTWNYGERDAAGKLKHVDIHAVAKEINGYFLEDVYDTKVEPPKLIGKKGDLVTSFPSLQADGTTSSGNWLYCNSYILKDGKEVNMMARRGKKDPTGLGLFPEWTWSWPVNRRIIYNRASVDLDGQPWDPKRPLLKFNATKLDAKTGKPGVWEGDVVDGGGGPAGSPTGKLPFIMKPDGIARSSAPDRGRAVPGTLRGPGVSARGEFDVQAAGQPDYQDLRRQDGCRLLLRCPVSLRLFHLPGIGALADRLHDAPLLVAAGDAAAELRRDERRAGEGVGNDQR